jgi:hypothetical protein
LNGTLILMVLCLTYLLTFLGLDCRSSRADKLDLSTVIRDRGFPVVGCDSCWRIVNQEWHFISWGTIDFYSTSRFHFALVIVRQVDSSDSVVVHVGLNLVGTEARDSFGTTAILVWRWTIVFLGLGTRRDGWLVLT